MLNRRKDCEEGKLLEETDSAQQLYWNLQSSAGNEQSRNPVPPVTVHGVCPHNVNHYIQGEDCYSKVPNSDGNMTVSEWILQGAQRLKCQSSRRWRCRTMMHSMTILCQRQDTVSPVFRAGLKDWKHCEPTPSEVAKPSSNSEDFLTWSRPVWSLSHSPCAQLKMCWGWVYWTHRWSPWTLIEQPVAQL